MLASFAQRIRHIVLNNNVPPIDAGGIYDAISTSDVARLSALLEPVAEAELEPRVVAEVSDAVIGLLVDRAGPDDHPPRIADMLLVAIARFDVKDVLNTAGEPIGGVWRNELLKKTCSLGNPIVFHTLLTSSIATYMCGVKLSNVSKTSARILRVINLIAEAKSKALENWVDGLGYDEITRRMQNLVAVCIDVHATLLDIDDSASRLLELAVKRLDIASVATMRALIGCGAEARYHVSESNAEKLTLLHLATSSSGMAISHPKRLAVIDFLCGIVDVNSVDVYGRTPLHLLGTIFNSDEAAKMLIRHGANVNAKTRRNDDAPPTTKNGDMRIGLATPLHVVCAHRGGARKTMEIDGVVNALIEAGADVEALSAQGRTVIETFIVSWRDSRHAFGMNSGLWFGSQECMQIVNNSLFCCFFNNEKIDESVRVALYDDTMRWLKDNGLKQAVRAITRDGRISRIREMKARQMLKVRDSRVWSTPHNPPKRPRPNPSAAASASSPACTSAASTSAATSASNSASSSPIPAPAPAPAPDPAPSGAETDALDILDLLR
jgi:hypothetical protein